MGFNGPTSAGAFAAGSVLAVAGGAVAATNVPPTEVGPVTPADRGLDFEEAAFDTVDGVTLSGWFMPAAGAGTTREDSRTVAGPGVILMHGAGSTRSAVLDHAEALVGHGYSVLAFDARGHGDSEGRAMDFGWYGDSDLGAAVDELRGRSDVDDERIAVVGLSMGGEQALGAAASNLAISAVVPDEVSVAEYLRDASPDTVRVWVAPGSGHTDALADHSDEWIDRVDSFLEASQPG